MGERTGEVAESGNVGTCKGRLGVRGAASRNRDGAARNTFGGESCKKRRGARRAHHIPHGGCSSRFLDAGCWMATSWTGSLRLNVLDSWVNIWGEGCDRRGAGSASKGDCEIGMQSLVFSSSFPLRVSVRLAILLCRVLRTGVCLYFCVFHAVSSLLCCSEDWGVFVSWVPNPP